jgi:hypothetical protein
MIAHCSAGTTLPAPGKDFNVAAGWRTGELPPAVADLFARCERIWTALVEARGVPGGGGAGGRT